MPTRASEEHRLLAQIARVYRASYESYGSLHVYDTRVLPTGRPVGTAVPRPVSPAGAPVYARIVVFMRFEAYHAVGARAHQDNFDRLCAAGFHPVCLSVSGDPGDPRYAAVWIDGPAPVGRAIHGLDAATYQATFSDLVGLGFAPAIVSATGPADRASFTAYFEQEHPEERFARHGLRWDDAKAPGSLQFEMDRAITEGFVPISLTVYGEPADRRFAGIWRRNLEVVAWSFWLASQDRYQDYFDALVAGGVRPSLVAVGPDGLIAAVFRDDQVGAWASRHGIDAGAYQSEFDARLVDGMRPISLDAGGIADATRYAAVFAADATPLPRVLSVTGDEISSDTELDAGVTGYLSKYGIRGLTLAIARDGTVVGRRAYTWAEPGYPRAGTTTRFRLASVSKAFCVAAIDELVARDRLQWDTHAFSYLGIHEALPAGTPGHAWMQSITISQLVLQTSGLGHDFPRLWQREIAAALNTAQVPIALLDLLRYLYGAPVMAAEADGYSNPAFYILTAIVERAAGKPFLDALNEYVLVPLGINDVSIASTGGDARQRDEITTYEHPEVHDSQIDYSAGALAPNAYGGTFVLENGVGAGGLIASTQSVARLIGHYPVWNAPDRLTGRAVGGTRYGNLDGTAAGAASRNDGLDFAFAFNRAVPDTAKDELSSLIGGYLDHHGSALNRLVSQDPVRHAPIDAILDDK